MKKNINYFSILSLYFYFLKNKILNFLVYFLITILFLYLFSFFSIKYGMNIQKVSFYSLILFPSTITISFIFNKFFSLKNSIIWKQISLVQIKHINFILLNYLFSFIFYIVNLLITFFVLIIILLSLNLKIMFLNSVFLNTLMLSFFYFLFLNSLMFIILEYGSSKSVLTFFQIFLFIFMYILLTVIELKYDKFKFYSFKFCGLASFLFGIFTFINILYNWKIFKWVK